MDTHGHLPLLHWDNYCQGKSMEEMRHSLFCATLELENTRQTVQGELKRRDEQLSNLEDLLDRTARERNEAENKCRKLLLEKFLIQQNATAAALAPASGISSIEDEPRRGIDSNNTFSSSDCEESIVSSPGIDTLHPRLPPTPATGHESAMELVSTKPLPEKGKLLQAVLKAGPLLQTLLLVGPLPQWRHPPPPVATSNIPPVRIPSSPQALIPPSPAFFPQDTMIINPSSASIENFTTQTRKRPPCDPGTTYPTTEGKHQRTALH
ncbi:hypothetical protein MLD38_008280 [Melastoma candidum]|uniref:Uncharacterized protein n=1 Tax=Melastoma candidum TaxID=119954 RepID=A0ACB9RTS6_9MYRT|nr:hypothetical protein MLD38_008280 [Melastoma candidum]